MANHPNRAQHDFNDVVLILGADNKILGIGLNSDEAKRNAEERVGSDRFYNTVMYEHKTTVKTPKKRA